MVEVGAVAWSDAESLDAFRTLLAAYEAALDEDLRIPDAAAEVRSLAERYSAGTLILARSNGIPAGCVVVNRLDARSAEVKRLYVVPSARGLGLGRELMEAAIAYARERGFGRVVLDTERERLAVAYELYRALGFVECDAYARAEYANPTFMELRLAAGELDASAAAGYEIEDQQDHAHDENEMNEPTGNVKREAEQPHEKQDDDDSPQ